MKILIVYGTKDGQTARVAARVSVRFREAGHEVVLTDLRALGARTDPFDFDAIVVGGPLHLHRYPWRVKRFVQENLATLQSRPSAFFSVCAAAASRFPDDRSDAHEIPRRFLEAHGWAPDELAVIAGAFSFSRYGFLRRFLLKRIAEKELGGPVETTRDRELTDWGRVDEFALTFVRRLERRRRAVAMLHPEPDLDEPRPAA